MFLMGNNGRQFFWSLLLSKSECLFLAEKWKTRLPLLEEVSDFSESNIKSKLNKDYAVGRVKIEVINYLEDQLLSMKQKQDSCKDVHLVIDTISQEDFLKHQKLQLKNKINNI